MTNSEIRKYLNNLPQYVDNYTNYNLWKDGLGPNKWYY